GPSRTLSTMSLSVRPVRALKAISRSQSFTGVNTYDKVEELYEAYCLQRRLRDGANKMVKAFLASPGSKEARESLAEANKSYREYTENMCVLESDLENHLGEFHIKMKLAGFARLCAGDQYEIFMRYGRQRWKLRGKIEVNSGQVWDSDEMVFQPLINEFLSVTELKSLANHVVVGSVSCETKDLFAALPQSVAVDINDLGTIKLNLEVTWPFDKDEQVSLSTSVNKAPSVTKRFSTIFNQSPPDTPSLREQAFYTVAADVLSNEEEDEAVDSELALALGEALGAVVSSIDDYRGQFPELQLLEQELKLLQTTLEGDRHSRTPSLVSLSVETVLGSFDFLNMSDCEEEEGQRKSNNEAPLTTGCKSLDQCLEAHLKYCSAQLLCLGIFGPLRCREMYALDRLLREAQVFKMIRRVVKKNPKCFKQPNEIPQLGPIQGAVFLWQQCVQQGCVYIVCVEAFQRTLSAVYSSVLPERMSNMADTFWSLAEQVLDQKLPQRDSSKDAVILTLFQWWNYLEASGVTDMETYISELAEEWLMQNLASLDQDVIVKVLRNPVKCSLKKQGIHAVAKLLKDPRGRVSASASSVLRGLASQPRPREQALVNCLELLEDENAATRICGCKALACLKAKESIEQLVYLCQTDKDDVREAAKQCLLVLEEGKMAIRHIETSQDSIPRLFAPGSMTSTAF
uniref:FAM65 N-terminal domain-containing protein n=1 Tax=Periophthalmus magnuspinnatus TaxID=409849 RepID=A0A3B4BBT3_9GOBI